MARLLTVTRLSRHVAPNFASRGGALIGLLPEVIRVAYTAGEMKRLIAALGLEFPAELTSMYLSHEPHGYIEAAVLAVNQRGA